MHSHAPLKLCKWFTIKLMASTSLTAYNRSALLNLCYSSYQDGSTAAALKQGTPTRWL